MEILTRCQHLLLHNFLLFEVVHLRPTCALSWLWEADLSWGYQGGPFMEGNRAGGEIVHSTSVGSIEEEDTLVQADVLVISRD